MKNAIQIVDVPVADGVRVLSEKRREIKPVRLIVTDDARLYTWIEVDKYEALINSLSGFDAFDAVRFTLRQDGHRTEVVRSFIDGDTEHPVLESCCMVNSKGETYSTELCVRNDILANYKEPVQAISPINIPCDIGLAKELFFRQGANWAHVAEAHFEKQIDVMDLLLDPTDRGVENFLLNSEVKQSIRNTYDLYVPEDKTCTQLYAANTAVCHIMNAMIKVLGTATPDSELVLQASVTGLDSLTSQSYVVDDLDTEDVHIVVTATGHNTKKMFIVFGAEDETDAKATFVQEFELEPEHITASTFKTIQFTYAN